MSKYLDYAGLQYYTTKVKGTYDPQIEDIKTNILTLADSNGKKNLFLPTRNSVTNPTGFTGTITRNEDSSYTINGTVGNSVYYHTLGRITLNAGTYILSARDDTTTYGNTLFVYNDGDWNDGVDKEKTLNTQTTYTIYVRIEKNTTINNFTIKPMICTKAQWDISHTYQPYAMSNVELTNNVATTTEIDNIWDMI